MFLKIYLQICFQNQCSLRIVVQQFRRFLVWPPPPVLAPVLLHPHHQLFVSAPLVLVTVVKAFGPSAVTVMTDRCQARERLCNLYGTLVNVFINVISPDSLLQKVLLVVIEVLWFHYKYISSSNLVQTTHCSHKNPCDLENNYFPTFSTVT